MLRQLSIRNFAIIDDLMIDFELGFNVFTGETGAGKSIIIDALGLLVGDRASTSMIRHGANKAFVEGVFNPISEIEINGEIFPKDEPLIVSREVDHQGRSTTRLNGRITSVSNVRLIMSRFIDIHNQNENLYLMDSHSHLTLLDNFIKIDMNEDYRLYQKHYEEYRVLLNHKESLLHQIYDKERIEMLEHQQKEIEMVHLQKGEIEALEEEKVRLMQFEKLAEKIRSIEQYFENDRGILVSLYEAKKVFDSLGNDPLITDYTQKINDFYFDIDATYEEFKRLIRNWKGDPERIEEIQTRIFEINKIKRKYGQTYKEIMDK